MKRCPRCGETYADSDINFCLADGELLSRLSDEHPTWVRDDAPPTVVMGEPRVTDRGSWDAQYAPPAPWQAAAVPQAQFTGARSAPSQTLALVSLGLGIAALTVGWCCWTGFLFAPAALITGGIAVSQIKKDPAAYTGRGLALAGIITGAVSLASYVLVMIIYGLTMIGGNL